MRRWVLCALLVLVPLALFAAGTGVVLVYHVDKDGFFEVHDARGRTVDVHDGDTLAVGWTVLTGKGDAAELQLLPSRTIIRLAGGTSLRIEAIRSGTSAGADRFSLAAGRIRAIAGEAGGRELEFFTQSAVCAVSGDAVVEWIDDAVTTIDGEVAALQGDTAITVAAGFACHSSLGLAKTPGDVRARLLNEMAFSRLDAAGIRAVHELYVRSRSPRP